MRVTLYNQSSQDIIVQINESTEYILFPKETKRIETYSTELALLVKNKKNSYVSKKAPRFSLTVETNYHLLDIKDDAQITILREKVQFAFGVCYDCCFLESEDVSIEVVGRTINSKESMRKSFLKAFFKDILFWKPLCDTPTLFFGNLIMLLVITVLWDALVALGVGAIFYCALIALNLILDKCLWLFQNKLLHIEAREIMEMFPKDFQKFLSDEYVVEYFNTPNRKPFLGEVEN